MYNMIKYSFLLTTALFVIVDCQVAYGCYRQPDSPCSQHTLTCPDDNVMARPDDTVIALDESSVDKIEYFRNNPRYSCPPDQMEICNATCCRRQGRINEFTSVTESYRLSVYRTCSNQQTCTVTSPYSPGNSYDYIAYPYICVSVNKTYNMMEITDVSFTYNGYLYYSGKTQTKGTTITRCCNITSTEPITIYSVYIDLTEKSSYNVKIYSEKQSLLRCIDEGGIFYGLVKLPMTGATMYHVVLDNLTVEEDDFIWLKIESNPPNMSITCGGDCPTSETTLCSEDQLGLIIGCVVGIVVVVVVVLAVYCIIRRRSKSCDNRRELEYNNNNNNRIESNEYDTIHDGNVAHQDRYRGVIAATPPRTTPAYWESCINLEPRSDPRTSPVDSKVKHSEVKPMSTRRQGDDKPSEYDHISTKTTTVNMGKDEPVDTDYDHFKHNSITPAKKDNTYYDHIPNSGANPRPKPFSDHISTKATAVNMGKDEPVDTDYDHFKHNSITPAVKDNTYYDHIPNSGANPRPKPFSDPTYDHLGERVLTKKPQQDKAVNLNQTSSNSQYQPQKSRAKVDDPYTDPQGRGEGNY